MHIILIISFLSIAMGSDDVCGGLWDDKNSKVVSLSKARENKENLRLKEKARGLQLPVHVVKQLEDLVALQDFLFSGLPRQTQDIEFYTTRVSGRASYPETMRVTITKDINLHPLFEVLPDNLFPEVPGGNFSVALFLQAHPSPGFQKQLVETTVFELNRGLGLSHHAGLDIKLVATSSKERVLVIKENANQEFQGSSYHYILTFVKNDTGDLVELRVWRQIDDRTPDRIRFLREL